MDLPQTPTSLVLVAAIAGILGIALGGWLWRLRARRRRALRRSAGYQLMDALKAYSAWMDYHRDEPIFNMNLDELSTPPPLLRASAIRERWFPELAGPMVRLLNSHRMMIEYLWEQNILRMSGGSMGSLGSGSRYLELRDLQDATLDSMFLRCRQQIGESDRVWHRTRSDFSFSSGLNLPSSPNSRA